MLPDWISATAWTGTSCNSATLRRIFSIKSSRFSLRGPDDLVDHDHALFPFDLQGEDRSAVVLQGRIDLFDRVLDILRVMVAAGDDDQIFDAPVTYSSSSSRKPKSPVRR